MNKLLFFISIILLSVATRAQTLLDTTFSTDGIVVHTRYNTTQTHPGQVNRMLVMPDSTILLGCNTGLNPDGPVGTYGFIFCRLDKRGNILDSVVNQFSIYYRSFRYVMPPGNISADWNGVRDLTLLPGNKVLLTGSVLNSANLPLQATFRFNYPSMKLDSTYGTYGMGQVWQGKPQIAEKTAIATDGSTFTISNYLYLDSLFGFIIKRKPNGNLDSSWQQNGVYRYVNQKGGQFSDIKVHSNGSMYISGMYKDNGGIYHAMVLKLNANGSTDMSYGINGIAEGEYVSYDLILNADGSTYVTGADIFYPTYYSGYVIKFKPHGTRDSSFATNGLFTNPSRIDIRDIIQQPDNKLLLIGVTTAQAGANTDSAWWTAWRLKPNGQFDSSFGVQGKYDWHQRMHPKDSIRYATCGILQPDGKLLIGGNGYTPNAVEMMTIRLTNKIDTPASTNHVYTTPNSTFSLQVYPVPANQQLHIDYTLSETAALAYTIVDMSGRVVYNERLQQTTPGIYHHTINIANLAPGTYLLKMQGTAYRETRLIVVQ